MKEVLSYKFFKNAEEFENWQVEEDRKIVSVMPSPNGMTATDVSDSSFSADVSVGAIVVYAKTVEVS